VTAPRRSPAGRSLAHWGTRAQIVVRTTQRELGYRWTAPRSPALRLLTLLLLLGATLLVLVIGLLALALFLVAAAVAVVVLAVAAGLLALAMRFSRSRRRTPG
jgi:Flp pilus assembly protein TadB